MPNPGSLAMDQQVVPRGEGAVTQKIVALDGLFKLALADLGVEDAYEFVILHVFFASLVIVRRARVPLDEKRCQHQRDNRHQLDENVDSVQ